MKKLISLLLTLTMLASLTCVNVSAYTSYNEDSYYYDDNDYYNDYYDDYYDKNNNDYNDYNDYDNYSNKDSYYEDYQQYSKPQYDYDSTESYTSIPGTTVKRGQKAGEKLRDLGILEGYPDGTLKLERTITRAEFLTMVLRITNNEASDYGNYGSYNVFSDISGHWAASNIVTGVNLGFLQGYPDGTFKPDADISSEEIQTILIRVLNYEESLNSSMAWPANIIAKSSQIGLTKNITNLQGQASRGSAAVFIDNALEIPRMVITGYNTSGNGNYVAVDENATILKDYLGYYKVKGEVSVTSENSSRLDADEFSLDDPKWYFNSDNYGNSSTFSMADRTSANHLLGRSVILYCDDENKVHYIEYVDEYEDGNIFYSTIKRITSNYITVSLDGIDERLRVGKDTTIFIDGYVGDLEDLNTGMFAKFIVTGNQISFLKVFDFTKKDIVITSISGNYISYVDSSGNEGRYNLNNYEGVNVFTGDRQSSVEQLRNNMVASVLINEDDELDFYISTTPSITGQLDRIYDDRIIVDGKSYSLAQYMTYADYSYSSSYYEDDVRVYGIDSASELQAFLGYDITVLFDLEGNARHFTYGDNGENGISLTNIGIVLRKWSSDEDYVRIYNLDTDTYGTYAYTFGTNDNTNKRPLAYNNISSLTDSGYTRSNTWVVGFAANSSQELTEIYKPELTQVLDVTDIYGNRYLQTSSGKYYIDEDTVFITDVEDQYNITRSSYENLTSATNLTGVTAIIVTAPYETSSYATNSAMYVIFVSGGEDIGSEDDDVAVVTNTFKDNNGTGIELYTQNGVEEFTVASNVNTYAYKVGDVVSYRLTTDYREPKVSHLREATLYSGVVANVGASRKSITLTNGATYLVKNNALVFDFTKVDMNYLYRNDIIKNNTTAGSIIRYSKIRYALNSDEQIIAMYILSDDASGEGESATAPTAVITMSPKTDLTPYTSISWAYTNSTSPTGRYIVDAEWQNKYSTYSIGTHTVSLRVKDSYGVWSNWVSMVFKVTADGTDSGIVGSTSTQVETPVAVITMTPGSNITPTTNINWDYKDSSVPAGRTIVDVEWQNKYPTYAIGTHTVALRVKDSYGNWSAWVSKTFTVSNAGTPSTPDEPSGSTNIPVAHITMTPDPATTTITPTTAVTLTSEGSSYRAGSYIANEEWQNRATYYEAGTHTVQLRIRDSYGNWSPWVSKTFTVSAGNQKPTVTGITTNPETIYANQAVSFTPVYVDPDGDSIVETEWDGKSNTYTQGLHVIKVRVQDSKGNWSDWYSKTISVEAPNLPPVIRSITMVPSNATTTSQLTFTYDAEDLDGDSIVDVEWRNYNNRPEYYSAGSQTVKVRVKDSRNAWSDWFTYNFIVANTGSPSRIELSMSPNPQNTTIKTTTDVSFSMDVIAADDISIVNYEWDNKKVNYPVGHQKVGVRGLDKFGNYTDWTYIEFDVVAE